MPVYGMYRETGKGPYRTQTALWLGGDVVNAGDLTYRDADGFDRSATNFPWTTNLVTTQTAFKQAFRGVSTARRTALQTANANSATDGPILASGEFCFPCLALGSALAPGALVGIAQNGSASSVLPQLVAPVTNVSYAIGKVTRDAAVGSLWLWFEIMPGTFDCGVQAVS